MALLPFEELIKVDVRPFCETRKAKDDNGNMVDIPYLNWAKCVKLLHENGAKDVWFTPRVCPETKTYLWPQADVTTRKGYKTQCWFVSVEIHIDELVFNMDTPLLNGALVVYEDTLNQLRISNAQARAFVKGVALRTGLGFDLRRGRRRGRSEPPQHLGHPGTAGAGYYRQGKGGAGSQRPAGRPADQRQAAEPADGLLRQAGRP